MRWLDGQSIELNHQFNGHELGQTPGDDEGQGGLVCCNPWSRKESDMTWQLNSNKLARVIENKNRLWVTEMAFCMLGSFPHLPHSLELLLRTTVNGF